MTSLARKTARTFLFEYSSAPTGRIDSWEPEECKLEDGGFYVELGRNYQVHNHVNGCKFSLGKISSVLKSLETMGKPVETLWGLRPSVIANLDKSKWTNLVNYFIKETKDFLTNDKCFVVDENKVEFRDITQNESFPVRDLWEWVDLLPFIQNPDNALHKYFAAYTECQKMTELDNPHEDLINLYEACGGNGHDLASVKHGFDAKFIEFRALAKEIAGKYPMLTVINSASKSVAPIIAEYVNQKDA
jgi:hypothetical protein